MDKQNPRRERRGTKGGKRSTESTAPPPTETSGERSLYRRPAPQTEGEEREHRVPAAESDPIGAKRGAFREIVAVFGGDAYLDSGPMRSYFDLDRVIHDGMPISAFRHAVELLEQPERTIVEGIGIARTTLGRRKAAGRLGFIDSERAVRLGSVVALAKEALGSTKAAGRWLMKPNVALGGTVPITLLRTDIGTRQVEAVLGRALWGAYS
jgi:putative toxin-antitoxin system antitoxin component (TIGR02293 family)